MHFTPLVELMSLASAVIATDDSTSRYSSCWADRGYLGKDAIIAGNILSQNNTFETGTFLRKNACIYNRHESTVVSLCNGSARNRTVNRGEVRRGIDQLIKDCNIDENGFSGVHVVNNLTFAAYGIYGGKNIKVPAGANPPDVPTNKQKRASMGDSKDFVPAPFKRNRYMARGSVKAPSSPASILLARRQDVDPCATMGYTGESKYNCHQKEGHTLVDGVCPSPVYKEDCWSYCEVRRTGFLGLESVPEGQAGTQNLPGINAVLAVSTEYSITHGVSVGIAGGWEDIIAGAVNYEFSSTIAQGKTVQQEGEDLDNEHRWRWVFFPKEIETCGDGSKFDIAPGVPNPNGGQSTPVCGDNVEETQHNICAKTAEIDPNSKQPIVFWAVRYEDDEGNPVPIEQQHKSYQDLCKAADPDRDGTQECAVGGE